MTEKAGVNLQEEIARKEMKASELTLEMVCKTFQIEVSIRE